ncbi:MAG: sulfatase, partial [Planctomycetota bacterium]
MLRVQHRLVDQQARAEGRERLPLATIRDETRYVLRASQKTQWPILFRSAAPDDSHISQRVPLPPELAGSEHVVLSPLLKLGKQVIDLPRQRVEIERRPGRSLVPIEIDLPAWVARRKVTLVVNGYGVSDESNLHDTAPLAVAPDAFLELGIGILEPAWDQGAVKFSVLACEASGCSPIVEETLDPAREQDRAWRDLRVPLRGLAGRPVWLRFETTLLVEQPGSFSLPVFSNPTIFSPEPRGEDEINVILISLDTLRADRLPPYGYGLETAPFLERAFGTEGTVVEHLVAAEATTSPAHMSIFTSLYPSVHRVSSPMSSLGPGVPTLTEILREEGFETGAITENGVLDITQGFGRGFNSYAENKSLSYLLPQGAVKLTLGLGREWLRRHGGKRFFLFLHTYQVHFPYQAPKAYRELFPVPAASHPPHPDLPSSHDPTRYDQEIRFVDDQLHLFYDTLRDEDLAGRTVVIVTSDHGEEFLEHGLLGHGTALHAEITHVPLLVRGP